MADRYVKKTFTFEGKRYYVYGKNESDALLQRELKKKELEEGRRVLSGNMSVSDWSQDWLETYKKPSVNYRHYKDIRNIIAKFIEPAIGDIQIKKVKPLHLQKIMNGLSNYSKSYNDKIYDVIRQIFAEAWRNNLIMENPAAALKKPAGRAPKKRRAITDQERAYTLRVAEYHRGGLFVLIMLYCGLRPGEVGALKWCDLDLEQRTINVHQAIKSDNSVKGPKTASGVRIVPIPAPLLERLLREDRSNPFSWVCTNTQGNRLTESSIQVLWESFRREMNIVAGCRMKRLKLIPPFPIAEDLTLYCYRHTYCTDLQAAGVPINVAKELMGHSSISVTAQIYTHRSEAAFNNAADLIDKYQGKNMVSVVQGVVQTS